MKNVTFIEELYEVDQLNDPKYIIQGNDERDSISNQAMNRHIRATSKTNPYEIKSGMKMQEFQKPHFFQDFQQYQPQQQIQQTVEPVQRQHYHYDEELSCMTIANHIKECPICSKFYNCDNSIYIVSIVLLIFICIILLKKIIEK